MQLLNNPTASIDEVTGIISFCLAPKIAPQISCEGATDHFIVHGLTQLSGVPYGRANWYVNDVLVGNYHMGVAEELFAGLTALGIKRQQLPPNTGWVWQFTNTTNQNMRIRIEASEGLDAGVVGYGNAVENPTATLYDGSGNVVSLDGQENASFRKLTVCLAPVSVVIPTEPERVDGDDLNGTEAVITFDEYGTVNPSYVRSTALLGTVTVTTGQHFNGQTLQGLGGSVYTLSGIPTANQPLTLSTDGEVYITDDGANPSSPILSGSPRFDAPISVLFSKDVSFITIDGGYFNTLNSVTIQAYDAQGNIVHQVTNSKAGIETFGISVGAVKIRGFSFFITGDEPGGFALDNLKFR